MLLEPIEPVLSAPGCDVGQELVNLGPLTAKTLAIVAIAGGFCVVAVGCAVGYVSLRRARQVRMQRFHSIVPDKSVLSGGADGLKEVSEVVNGSTEAMLDQTEGIEAVDDVRQEAITTA